MQRGQELKYPVFQVFRVVMWQAHDSGHAPSPPPTGRDESEDTQVELVMF